MKKLLVSLIAIGLVLGLSSCSNEDQETTTYPETVKFGVLRVPNDETLAITTGILTDNFAELGINCEFIPFDSGSQANNALVSNSIDFATMGNTNAIVALATGIDVQLCWIHEVLGDVEALVVRDGTDIQTVADLAGKKIAVPFASTSHYILLNVLKEAGIENDVTLLNMKTSEIIAAWERGDVDAAYTWQPSLGQLLTSGSVLVSSADMLEKGYITANVDVVQNSFAEKYPDLVALYISSLAEAADMYENDHDNVVSLLADELDLEDDEVEIVLNGSIWVSRDDLLTADYFGTSEKSGNFAQVMKDTSDFLLEQNSITNSPDLEAFQQFVNPEYIELSLNQEIDN